MKFFIWCKTRVCLHSLTCGQLGIPIPLAGDFLSSLFSLGIFVKGCLTPHVWFCSSTYLLCQHPVSLIAVAWSCVFESSSSAVGSWVFGFFRIPKYTSDPSSPPLFLWCHWPEDAHSLGGFLCNVSVPLTPANYDHQFLWLSKLPVFAGITQRF